jgi:hypothetical protein
MDLVHGSGDTRRMGRRNQAEDGDGLPMNLSAIQTGKLINLIMYTEQPLIRIAFDFSRRVDSLGIIGMIAKELILSNTDGATYANMNDPRD